MSDRLQYPYSQTTREGSFIKVSPTFLMDCDNCRKPGRYEYGYIPELGNYPALLRKTADRVPPLAYNRGYENGTNGSTSATSATTATHIVANSVKCRSCMSYDKPCNSCIPCRTCWESRTECTYDRTTWTPAPPAPVAPVRPRIEPVQADQYSPAKRIKLEDDNERSLVRLHTNGLPQNSKGPQADAPEIIKEHTPSGSFGPSGSTALRKTRWRPEEPDKSCSVCGTMATSTWRRDREKRVVCNACGLRLRHALKKS